MIVFACAKAIFYTKQLMNLQHYKETIRLGLPIVIGQIGVIVLGFADTMMVGHYNTESLAAASFVNNVMNLIIITLLGFSYGITPIIGGLFARRELRRAGKALKEAVVTNLIIGLLFTAIMGIVYFHLDAFNQPKELMPIIRPYYLTILSSLVFVALFNAMRQFTDSIMQTSTAMWLLITGNLLNILFNYLLIFGKFGFPELGALGAGISTLGSRIFMALAFMLLLYKRKCYALYREGFRLSALRLKGILRIARISFPVALQMGMETGTFTISAIMVGWIGTIELASYQVLATLSTLGFMFYYSMGSAVAIRVANFMGVGDRVNVRRAAWSGYYILLGLAVMASIIFFVFSGPLISGFTSDPRVIATSQSLIGALILYQFGDATQTCFANALRGTSEVLSMMVLAFISYILIGIPTSYLLAFPAGLGVQGIFLSFTVALLTAGILFLLRFNKATRLVPQR